MSFFTKIRGWFRRRRDRRPQEPHRYLPPEERPIDPRYHPGQYPPA